MPPAVRHVYAYVRVSGAEQGRSGTSLEAQRDELVAYCKGRKLPTPRVFVEVESAAVEKLEARAQLRALLRAVAAGDLVIVTKVDRWSRDIAHAVQSVRDLVKKGVGFISTSEGIDATTANGDSQLGIMAWAADNERKRIRERMVGTRKVLRAQGLYVEGLPPLAYKRGPDRRLHIIPSEAPIVRQMYRRALRGSLNTVSDWLKVEHPGVRAWAKSYVARLLSTRTYLGEVLTPDGSWVASHEAIVTRDVWERTQAALTSRRLSGRAHSDAARTATWLLRGLATCGGCGSRMGAAYRGAADYYLCARRARTRDCSNGYMPVPATDAAMGALVVARLAALASELGKPGKAPPVGTGRDWEKARRALGQRRERLIDALEAGLDRETFRARIARLDAESGRIEVEAGVAKRGAVVLPPARRAELLAEVRVLERAWARMRVAKRRELVGWLAHGVVLSAGAEPAPTWRTVAELSEEMPENE
jgi:DNA invertase Pin-like site-specific DNA recombinase